MHVVNCIFRWNKFRLCPEHVAKYQDVLKRIKELENVDSNSEDNHDTRIIKAIQKQIRTLTKSLTKVTLRNQH